MADILLRELREDDIPYWYSWFNDPEVTESLNKGAWPNNVTEQLEFLKRLRASQTDVQFAIAQSNYDHRNTTGIIGTIGIHKIDWVHRRGDVSIVIGKKGCRGKGVGTEAIRQIVRHGFEKMNLRKLTAGMWANNIGSVRAFEKNGFVLEGTLKENFHYRGQYVDELRYGLFRDK